MKEQKYCENPACDPPRPTHEGRRYCPRCTKRAQRAKDGGIPLSAPPVERLTPIQRVLELGTKWLETPAEAPQDVYDANQRKFLQAAREAGGAAVREAISAGMKAAKARGVRIGRPPKLAGADQLAQGLVREMGVTRAARALQVARSTLRRLLRGAAGAKGNCSLPPSEKRQGAKGGISLQ